MSQPRSQRLHQVLGFLTPGPGSCQRRTWTEPGAAALTRFLGIWEEAGREVCRAAQEER